MKKIPQKISTYYKQKKIMSQSNPYYSKYSKKQYCPVKCSTDVELELDVKQKVNCREISRKGTEFDIELDFEVKHNCKLTPKRTYKDESGCITKCVFAVELDFDCTPKIRHNSCNKPSAKFELDVELEVSPNCKPIEGCKVKYYKAQEEQDHEHEHEHVEPEPECRSESRRSSESSKTSETESTKTSESEDSLPPRNKYDDEEEVFCNCDKCRAKDSFEEPPKKTKNSYWL